MSIALVLQRVLPCLLNKDVYEMSSRGAFFRYLKRSCNGLTFSEYYEDIPVGTCRGQIQCQDVQRLTFADNSFDLCTSTEVFEHVPDDLSGFRELARVLRTGGIALFTVPVTEPETTVERAHLVDGRIEHLCAPAYHGDRIRGQGGVLCFRDYGPDILERLRSSGFSETALITPDEGMWWGQAVPVVFATK